MIHLAYESVENVVLCPGSRYGSLKVTNNKMTAHKGLWSWTAQEVSKNETPQNKARLKHPLEMSARKNPKWYVPGEVAYKGICDLTGWSKPVDFGRHRPKRAANTLVLRFSATTVLLGSFSRVGRERLLRKSFSDVLW
jgi:hypothetical protein